MNPHATQPASPIHMVKTLWSNRRLLDQLARRDVAGRYKGAAIGVAWSFLTPLLMLCVYTFVFSVVFQARWGGELSEGRVQFALIMFVGILVHTLFSEVVNRAPGLILSNPNYVKKVVFPLEVLPVMAMASAIFHACISVLILLLALLVLNGRMEWTSIFLPIVLAPLVVLTVGVAWFLAALGVYLRDVGQITSIMTMVMLFLAPVFYPITALPEPYQAWMSVNPITVPIEQARRVLFAGQAPEPGPMMLYWGVALMLMLAGYTVFQSLRRGFADVL